MTEEADRRIELGKFLRARRESVNPQDVGFPATGRRRTSGLRREEVAVLAGVSTTWYTYLEQGRNNNVSPAVLNSVARVLQLTEDEMRYMHFLSSGHMPDEMPPNASFSATELMLKVAQTAEHHPYPVYLVDHRCDLLSWNTAAAEWYDDWSRLPANHRNFIYWLFTAPRAREAIVDWDDFGRDITARWRLEIARWPRDQKIEDIVEQLAGDSSEFVDCWSQYAVSEHHANIRRLRHPRLGEREMVIAFLRCSPYSYAPGLVYHFPLLRAPAHYVTS